jgi:hypothetical protein
MKVHKQDGRAGVSHALTIVCRPAPAHCARDYHRALTHPTWIITTLCTAEHTTFRNQTTYTWRPNGWFRYCVTWYRTHSISAIWETLQEIFHILYIS